MNRQMMIDTITSKLSQMGIPVQISNAADIEIHKEFLDAKWGSGNKKIDFYASAYLDDSQQTLFYWEFTKDIGGGFSFGSSSETSFQSGMTLMRKVKSVGYDLGGKAYEYNIDLGAITKAFKETARQHGWKFKVVLSKEKASYPSGYSRNIPPAALAQPAVQSSSKPLSDTRFCTNCGENMNNSGSFCTKCGEQINSQPQQSAKPAIRKTGLLFKVIFVLIMIMTAGIFGLSEVSVFGWSAAALLFILVFLSRKLISKNFFTGFISWVVILVILFITLGFTSSI